MAPGTVHGRILEQIESRIRSGVYGPGQRLPAEVRLAADLGVSRGTLRHALASLRRSGLIEGTPGRGTFVRGSPGAPEPGSRTVAVVVPLVAQPPVPELMRGIEGELRRRGYTMVIGDGGSSAEQQSDRISHLLDQGASALIAYPVDYEPDPGFFERLFSRGVPLVLVDRYLPGLAVDAVVSDNVSGAYEAVSSLAAAGHRRIAMVATDNLATSSVAERILGYRQALHAAGLPFDPDLVFDSLPVISDLTASHQLATDAAQRIADFLAHVEPTAVFALNDRLAVEVYRASQIRGLPIPDALSVIGFDNDPMAAAMAPSLSSVAQPREAIGRRAAALAVDRLEGRSGEVARYVLPVRLVVRESSAGGAAVASATAGQPVGA
jgi:DNA-binding LacI/PurR family transcriptional regulator